jgi:predicted Na+-dependent transporter
MKKGDNDEDAEMQQERQQPSDDAGEENDNYNNGTQRGCNDENGNNDIETAVTTTTTKKNDDQNKEVVATNTKKSWSQRLCELYQQQEFLLWILAAIGLAKLYPILGANYLQPNITSDWIAVVLIFFLSGLSLRTSEIVGAVSSHWRFHLVVQLFSLGVVPAVVYGITRLLLLLGDNKILARPLADGMVICACLPMTINMVMVLTKAAGGDDASALVGAVVGNGVGVILSPLLILAYLGIQGNVNVGEVFIKLALRVLLPVIIGQVLQKTTNVYETIYQPHKKVIAKMQQLLLGTFRHIYYCSWCVVTSIVIGKKKKSNNSQCPLARHILLLSSLYRLHGLLRNLSRRQRRTNPHIGCFHHGRFSIYPSRVIYDIRLVRIVA